MPRRWCSECPRRCVYGERGFALPLTIFLITLVTIMLAAVFVRVSADRRMAETSGSTADALAIAHSGLQRYFAHYDSLDVRPPDRDSLRFNVTGGYADVVAHFVQRPADTLESQMYVVRSTGRAIEPTEGAEPQAVRRVAQFAQWQTGNVDDVVAAFTAPNGLRKVSGGFIEIWGEDQCGEAPTKHGLRAPYGPLPDPIPDSDIRGSSPAVWEGGNGASVATETDIDWQTILGGGFEPDFASVQLQNWNWSSQMITGDLTLNNTWGSGLLIVTGDLELRGASVDWYGIILVGGEIEFDATTTTIRGLVVSGLDELLPGTNPPRGDIGATTIRIWYDSCHVTDALRSLTGFTPIANAWVDNWATY